MLFSTPHQTHASVYAAGNDGSQRCFVVLPGSLRPPPFLDFVQRNQQKQQLCGPLFTRIGLILIFNIEAVSRHIGSALPDMSNPNDKLTWDEYREIFP